MKYHLVILFSYVLVQVFCPFLNWIVYPFLLICIYISWYKYLVRPIYCQYTLLLCVFFFSRYKGVYGVYILWFFFMRFKKQAKLTYCNRSQKSANLWWVREVLMTVQVQWEAFVVLVIICISLHRHVSFRN